MLERYVFRRRPEVAWALAASARRLAPIVCLPPSWRLAVEPLRFETTLYQSVSFP